jgi:hypothetical protein
MANVRDANLWQTHVIGQGYVERTITKNDPEVKLYDVTVSTAAASDGRLNLDGDFFVWTCPITSFARLVNGFIPRLKLYDNTGTELSETAKLIFKIKNDVQPRGIPIAFVPYSNFKRLTVAQQISQLTNAAVAIEFDVKGADGRTVPFVDIQPNWQLVLAVTGSSQQIDVDQTATVIEIDLGIRTQ